MATIANLSVSITARTAKFVKGLKHARRSLNRFAGITEEVARGVEDLGRMRDTTTGLIGTRLQEFMDGVPVQPHHLGCDGRIH